MTEQEKKEWLSKPWIDRKLTQLVDAAERGDDAMVGAMWVRISMHVEELEKYVKELEKQVKKERTDKK